MKSYEILEYLRKSRADDPTMTVEEVLSRHETILSKWAEDNLDEPIPPDNIFREVVSGETIDARPQMLKLLKLIESPAVKAVLVVEVQRLSRGDLEDAGRIIKLFRYTNTLVITPMKTYDLSNEYDRDIFERELKRGNEYLEYTKKILSRGRNLSAQQGFFVASEPPFGYDRIPIMDGRKKRYTLIPNDDARTVKMIYDLYINHAGMTNIAKYLNNMGVKSAKETAWTKNTIRKILTNHTYCGKIVWRRRQTIPIVQNGNVVKHQLMREPPLIYEGKHKAIISDEDFQAVQSQLGHKAHYTVGMCINPLSGLLYCSCGYSMLYQDYKKARARILCSMHCNNNRSSAFEDVYAIVIDTLRSYIHDFDIQIENGSDELLQSHRDQIQVLEKRLQELDKIELAQWEKFSDPEIQMPKDVFDKLNEKVKKERLEVKEALDFAYQNMPAAVDYKEKRVTFSKCLDALLDDNASAGDKNALLKKCFQKIVYSRSKDLQREYNGKLMNCGAISLDFYLNI